VYKNTTLELRALEERDIPVRDFEIAGSGGARIPPGHYFLHLKEGMVFQGPVVRSQLASAEFRETFADNSIFAQRGIRKAERSTILRHDVILGRVESRLDRAENEVRESYSLLSIMLWSVTGVVVAALLLYALCGRKEHNTMHAIKRRFGTDMQTLQLNMETVIARVAKMGSGQVPENSLEKHASLCLEHGIEHCPICELREEAGAGLTASCGRTRSSAVSGARGRFFPRKCKIPQVPSTLETIPEADYATLSKDGSDSDRAKKSVTLPRVRSVDI